MPESVLREYKGEQRSENESTEVSRRDVARKNVLVNRACRVSGVI